MALRILRGVRTSFLLISPSAILRRLPYSPKWLLSQLRSKQEQKGEREG